MTDTRVNGGSGGRQEQPDHWRYMFTFKTEPCSKANCDSQEDCWDYHSHRDMRRVPVYDGGERWFNYHVVLCSSSGKNCGGSNCGRAHNYMEVSFHPILYKTKMCSGRLVLSRCTEHGLHCAYAHSASDLRNPGLLYPSKRAFPEPKNPPSPKKGQNVWIAKPPPGFENMGIPETVVRPIPSVPISNEDLFKLYQEQGALETRLKQLEEQIRKRKVAGICCVCRDRQRTLVHNICGHCVCSICVESCQDTCPSCGKTGTWIVLIAA